VSNKAFILSNFNPIYHTHATFREIIKRAIDLGSDVLANEETPFKTQETLLFQLIDRLKSKRGRAMNNIVMKQLNYTLGFSSAKRGCTKCNPFLTVVKLIFICST
jgi:hypothetical protein